MRLARLMYSSSYVVDLDNKEMVQAAEDMIQEDIEEDVKNNEVMRGIKIIKDKKLKKSDIPSFLLDG